MFNAYTVEGNTYIFEDSHAFNGRILLFVNTVGKRTGFRIKVENRTDSIIESITFPILDINCTMLDNGGEDTLFWPSMEGVIISDSSNEYVCFAEDSYGAGYCGITPGSATMQYMAFFSPKGNIYYGAHDKACGLKDFEYRFIDDNTVQFICRLYPNGCKNYDMPYDMVIEDFEGDWQDAAEIYRTWLESSGMKLPEKLYKRHDLPAWFENSPITMLYPVRGTADTDRDEKMAPNCYYPYTNILPIVDYFAEKTDSQIMPLLMHWEGTSPWATPYVWPPYGDINSFNEMVKGIHERGHLVGLYASGLGITTQGVTDSSYVNTDEYKNGGWKECTARDINGEPIFTALGFVRSGYDVCPSCEKVKRVMIDEALKIANADIDYFQAFDQNLGGTPRLCWSTEHNHPSAPGSWINDEMNDLFEKINTAIKENGENMIIGCELAASETAINHLPLNDLRYFTAYRQGIPVPAYSYIYHEYINNYMGNQNGIQWMTQLDAAPDNLLYRTAYAFLAGDMLTIVLGDNGRIGWGWNAPFDGSYPEEEIITEFMKNANEWRRGFTKKYLRYGKMLKCSPADCESSVAVVNGKGKEIIDKNVMTSKYAAQDGTVGQFFVNRTSVAQKLTLSGFGENAKLYYNTEDSCDVPESIILDAGQIICVIE